MNKDRISELFQKNHNITAIVMCAAGIALNVLLGALTTAFNLPLYLDTVGTVVVTILGGALPGAFVGFMTNIINFFTDSSAIYYGVINVLIAIFAGVLADRGWHKSIRGMCGMALVFTLLGGVLGAAIPWFMEGLSFDNESLANVIYGTGVINKPLSWLFACLTANLPDKSLTVLIAMIIVRLVPKKYYGLFVLSAWQQKPISDEEVSGSEKTDLRLVSLRTKILISLSASLLIVSSVAMGIGMSIYRKSLMNDHIHIAQGTAGIVATVLDGDKVDEYIESRGRTREYRSFEKQLEAILEKSTGISFLYVYKIEEDGCHVVFDIDSNGYDADAVGSVMPFDESFSEEVPKLLAGKEIDPIIAKDQYGYLLTAYEPVFDSQGNCVCYVGADVDMKNLRKMTLSSFVEMVSVFLSFFFLICVQAIWLAKYHIIIPVNSIMKCMDRFSQANDSQESLDEHVKSLRNLDIHTGDEIERLYISACEMTKTQAEQMRSIRRLSESTSKMQDGLIITMADLVESRDSDTGAHVQKTAAYVKIIVEAMKKKGYYAEKITPKFMSDVVRSAPLHDIGKINIPDGVLNKPGKLTEEEYEIMKGHTTAGKRILENAITTVEGDNYLKEARNMAAYHHERWDGKGYPEGIHGEVIPLSARIMAVADVFDALTAARVYKPGFPIEKALAIIEEGKGKQFDPKCVDAFMDSLDEVKVILRKYNKNV